MAPPEKEQPVLKPEPTPVGTAPRVRVTCPAARRTRPGGPNANPYAPPQPGAYPNGGRPYGGLRNGGPNGTAHWPQNYGGQQPGGYPGGPAGQSGPPNYGAPPGWTPATSPGGQPGQSWRPGGDERPREHGWFADQAGNQQSEGERRDVDGPEKPK